MSLSSNLLRLARSLARGVFPRSGVSSLNLAGVQKPRLLSNSNTPGIPQPSSCPASGGAGQSPLVPLRRPFSVNKNLMVDGWGNHWYRHDAVYVPGLVYWVRLDHEDDDNRKLEHAVEVNGEGYEIGRSPYYRTFRAHELAAIAWQLMTKPIQQKDAA